MFPAQKEIKQKEINKKQRRKMAHIRCDFRSETLDMGTSMTAFLPENIDCSKAKVVYLLHGLSDNCTGWSRYTSVERYARRYNVAVIMPEVQRSFYSDMTLGLAYFTFVSQELPQICSNLFGLSKEKKLNYIMGLSMGGYGAIKNVLNFPDKYEGCASFSAVTDIVERVSKAEGSRENEYKAIFGQECKVPANCNLFEMLSFLETSKTNLSSLPRFYMACGKQDALLAQNERFASELIKAGIDCKFESWDGIHSWDFWDPAVEKAFSFFFEKTSKENS